MSTFYFIETAGIRIFKKYNIDGVYVLDPTWDSKRNNIEDTIDKYNYFLIPIEIAEKTALTELMPIINMSLSDLVLLENDFEDSLCTN